MAKRIGSLFFIFFHNSFISCFAKEVRLNLSVTTNGRIVFCQKFLSALFRLNKIVHLILGFNYFYFCLIIYCCQEVNDLCRQLGFLAKAKCFLGNFLFFQIFHWSNLLLCLSTTNITWTDVIFNKEEFLKLIRYLVLLIFISVQLCIIAIIWSCLEGK